MARNRIQFQKGYSLVQFMDEYGSEEKCTEALFRWRWPNGFVCPRCEHTGHCRHKSRWSGRPPSRGVTMRQRDTHVACGQGLTNMLAVVGKVDDGLALLVAHSHAASRLRLHCSHVVLQRPGALPTRWAVT